MAKGHHILYPTHDAAYWAKVTAGMDFSAEDRIDFARYNHILWEGLMGSKPYPSERSGLDLRSNRKALLANYRAQAKPPAAPLTAATPKLAERSTGGD